MKKNTPKTQARGFTLVEIAIVLMIIGLLIGGILRGQELITSARVRNIIDQKAAIQTAQIGFMDQFVRPCCTRPAGYLQPLHRMDWRV